MIFSETAVSSLSKKGVVPVIDDDFATEVDSVDEKGWHKLLNDFADANIYQTWGYEVVRSGQANVSHLVIKQQSSVVAAVQARLLRIPYLGLGVAYVRWGPLWKRRNCAAAQEVFRRTVRALRDEYVGRRGLVLRIVSSLIDQGNRLFRRILEEEGYVFQEQAKPYRTILMDLRPSLEELYQGLHQKWRNCLNGARKRQLEIIEGEDDVLFDSFERVYAAMRDRKQFISYTDLRQYKRIQRELPAGEKMRVFLGKVDGEPCAGAICSGLGSSGLYLFGAISNRGMKTNASYLVQWKVLEWLKARGCEWYDLNGINPTENEGTYRFKSRLAGRYGQEINFLGQYDCYRNTPTRLFVRAGDLLRTKVRLGRERFARLKR
jgi:hypothetical protein